MFGLSSIDAVKLITLAYFIRFVKKTHVILFVIRETDTEWLPHFIDGVTELILNAKRIDFIKSQCHRSMLATSCISSGLALT